MGVGGGALGIEDNLRGTVSEPASEDEEEDRFSSSSSHDSAKGREAGRARSLSEMVRDFKEASRPGSNGPFSSCRMDSLWFSSLLAFS